MDKNDQIALEKASRQIHTKNLRNIFEKEIFSDFTIHTKDEDFKAHKSILSGRSVYFYQYLKEKNINEIKIQINSETMKQILNFIYTDEIEFNSSNILDIYKYSTIFQLHSLLTEIVKKLDEFIDETNAFKILQESEKFSSSKLKDSCINFIYSKFKRRIYDDDDDDNNVFDEQNQKTAEILKNPDILELSKQQITDLSKKLIEENQYFIQIIQILFNWTQHQIERNPLEKLNDEKDFEKLLNEIFHFPESSVKDLKSNFEIKKDLEKFIKLPDEIIYKIMSKITQFQIWKLNENLKKQKDDNEIKNKKIESKNEEIQAKDIEIDNQKKEIENKEGKIQLSMREIKKLKDLAKDAQILTYKSTRMFLLSEIIENEEEDQQLQKWVDDNEFLFTMNLGFSLKEFDSSSSENFYGKVNDKGRTLILVRTTDDYIFGAYTTVGFQSNKNNEFIEDPKAFLFSLKNPDKEPKQFPILPGKEKYALFYNAQKGPYFGGNGKITPDLVFNSSLKSGVTNIGYTYGIGDEIKPNSNDSKSYLAGSLKRWEVKIFEVYFV
eukprot:Anaeramoba_ignava/a478211_80.p1 GENE.a478211_80~~a478211_80.p1  ORF type:complete len:552 (-),score=216.55 a478211_80:124-1779(-)